MNAIKDQQKDLSSQKGLLFIPDISGFTRFVSGTEEEHSRHIIRELLEEIISANEIGLEISEIEGDAILFYRAGQAPTAAELLAQIQKMFVKFHAHLKKYDLHRICSCGSCTAASGLSLKFIAHYGDMSQNKVQNFQKLFGKEVILAHRLLKNQVEGDEYALFTHPLVNACKSWVDVETVSWAKVENGTDEYDCGKVSYCHISLEPLMQYIPEPKIEDFGIPGKKIKAFHTEAVIDAPIDLVFNVVSDLPWRVKWIPGTLEELEDHHHKILQTGTTHRCLAEGPVIVTHNFSNEPDHIYFTETDSKKTFCVTYDLISVPGNKTRMSGTGFMKKHFLMNIIFNLFMKSKMQKVYNESWANLKNYILSLQNSGKEHPAPVILEAEELAA